ncbi:hypothetical protein L7F22_031112 [Adiantum nelumboides]|nr:hypothetical protein [Adiantum nelumboides]
MSDFIRAQQPALRGLLMPVADEPDLIDQEYADDTLLFLHHSHDVLDTIQYALEVFCVASGDASTGTSLMVGMDVTPEQQFSSVMQSMRRKLSYWSTQHLSLAGRALVANQDLIKSAVEGCSDIQMLQRSGSLCSLAGEGLLVFETEDLADAALQQFEENCLVISGCTRPLIARKVVLSDPGKFARFPGHFPLDNFKLWKQRQEEVMTKSFENSHFADPKTVEFEMASEWKNLQEWLAQCWEQLCKIRTSSHQLEIEFGRFQGIPPEDRLCNLCGTESET